MMKGRKGSGYKPYVYGALDPANANRHRVMVRQFGVQRCVAEGSAGQVGEYVVALKRAFFDNKPTTEVEVDYLVARIVN